MKAIIAILLSLCSLALPARETRDSLSVDGPYVLYTDGGVRVITVDKDGTIEDNLYPEAPATFKVTDHLGHYPFEVSLRPFSRQEWLVESQPERVFVMSDPHGRLDCVVSLLQGNNVIDSDLRWSYGQDHLVMIGDIFDRGEHADLIMDLLMNYENELDIQWGNHDILWMGAAAGNPASIFVCINNNVKYGNYEVLENGYGISMRNLVLFAEKTYTHEEGMDPLKKAISVLIFKLEGQLIKRHPEYKMDNRMLLGQVDWDNYTITAQDP